MTGFKEEHNFGTVEFNSTHTVSLPYTGTSELNQSMFVPGCGCTTPFYDSNAKRLVVSLNMNSRPIKETYITCNLPEGQHLIKLTAQII